MRRILLAASLALAAAIPVHAATFLAPRIPARALVDLPAPLEKRATREVDDSGRLRVGNVRGLAKAAAVPAWQAAGGRWVTRFSVRSADAEGLRVRLDLDAVPGAFDVRVQGTDGAIEAMQVDPRRGPDAWTPWTEGDTQLVEIASDVRPAESAVRVGAVSHFDASPVAKAAGSCTVPINCSTNDTALDAAIAQAKKSMMRINFIETGGSFVCTATLIDTPRNPAAYVMTANHCVGTPDVARTITTLWNYENASCDGASAITRTQVAGGMDLVFGNHNVDSTLLLMTASPPSGAVYVPINRAHLDSGTAMVSLSHPAGDAARLALGTLTNEYRLVGRPQDFYGVRFSRGIIEGGSSGSALFVMSGAQLQFRGTLLGTTLNNSSNGMSCTDTNEDALYSRFDIFAPEIDAYIGAATHAADDAPNRPQDLAAAPNDTPVDQRSSPIAIDGLKVDYAGDLDTFKFTLSSPAVVSAWSEGPNGANLDTVGAILGADGHWIGSNDDAGIASNHFGVTQALDAGTYYVQVGHFESAGTGNYNLRIRADKVDSVNYTDLWGNVAEPGWGINIAHDGNTVFASLFTYDASGNPLWLAMSNGVRQADGSFAGNLERYSGAAFNAPWRAATASVVGTMRIAFANSTSGTLTYTYDGATVTKPIARNVFAETTVCHWSAFDRGFADNYQDLWYTAAEPGSGLNIAHEKDILFASLFTYDANGNPLWLYMSSGNKVAEGRYSGTLYRSRGVAFNAVPWTAATPVAVGKMTLDFTDTQAGFRGDKGTLTYTVDGVSVSKPIQRFSFGALAPDCSSEGD